MESRSWGARIGELSTLIYLIFPILAIFVDKRGNLFTYLIACISFFASFGLVSMSLTANSDFKVRLANTCPNVS